jgi:two-component system, OmpR family, sensor histidine kinase CpxA
MHRKREAINLMKYLNPFNSLFGKILLGFWLTVTLVGLGSSWLTRLSFDNPELTPANAAQVEFAQKIQKKFKRLSALQHYQNFDNARVEASKIPNIKFNYFIFNQQNQIIPPHIVNRWVDQSQRKVMQAPLANDIRRPRGEDDEQDQFKHTERRTDKNAKRVGMKKNDIPATVVDLLLSNEDTSLQSIYWRGRSWLGAVPIEINGESYRLITPAGPDGNNADFLNTPRARLLLTLIVSTFFSIVLAYSFTKPLLSLRKTTKALSNGHLDARPDDKILKRGDEYGSLARQMNETAEHIQKLLQAQQTLLANVSHELRSPLTRLQLACELAKMKSTADSNELARIELESARLEAMIAKLLKLSRLENQMLALEKETVDLVSLSKQIILNCQSEADVKQLIVDVNVIDQAMVQIDVEMIHSAIENIYRNAIRFSPVAGVLTIALTQTQESVSLSITDQGVGVPEIELVSMFEPFIKSSTSDHTGVGLGLAIAKQAVQRHGGDIVASINPEGGLIMTLNVPK